MPVNSKPLYVRAKAYRCEISPKYKGIRWTKKELEKVGDQYIRGSPFFHEHNYKKKCVGEVVDWFIEQDGWLNVGVLITPDDDYKLSVISDLKSGKLGAFSIGYLATPKKDGSCSKDWIEVSATSDPDVEGAGGMPSIIVCHSKDKRQKEQRVLIPLSKKGKIVDFNKTKDKKISKAQKEYQNSITSLFQKLKNLQSSKEKTMSGKKGKKTDDKKKKNSREDEDSDVNMSDVSDVEDSDVSSDEENETQKKKGNSKQKSSSKQKKEKEKISESDISSDESEQEEPSEKMSSKKSSEKNEKNLRDKRREALKNGGDPRKVNAPGKDLDTSWMSEDMQKQIAKMSDEQKAKKIAELTLKLGETVEVHQKTQKEREAEKARLAAYEKKERREQREYAKKRTREADEVTNNLLKAGVFGDQKKLDDRTKKELQAVFTTPEAEGIASVVKNTCATLARKEQQLAKYQRRLERVKGKYSELEARQAGYEHQEDLPLSPEAQQQVLVQHSRAKKSKEYAKYLGVKDDDLSESDDSENEQEEQPKRRRVAQGDEEEDGSSKKSSSVSKFKTREAFLPVNKIPNFNERLGASHSRFLESSLQKQNPKLFESLVRGTAAQAGMGMFNPPKSEKKKISKFLQRNQYSKDELKDSDEEQ